MTTDSEKPVGAQLQAEIDGVLEEFGGDARKAIAALLHDLNILAADAEASTSRGYVRGKVMKLQMRRKAS